MRNERLTILLSPEEKAEVVSRARELGLSAGETLRLAFIASKSAPFDDAFLDAFAADVEQTLSEAEARIDRTLASAEAMLSELRASRRPARAA